MVQIKALPNLDRLPVRKPDTIYEIRSQDQVVNTYRNNLANKLFAYKSTRKCTWSISKVSLSSHMFVPKRLRINKHK